MLTIENQNRLNNIFGQKKSLLGIYLSAGFPYLDATGDIIKSLQENMVDFVEVGMPYSDPMADGKIIEACHSQALKNGMTINLMFEQLKEIKSSINIPVVLMGYFNPVFKFGFEKFSESCEEAGVDAVILPDMPPDLYVEKYYQHFNRWKIQVIFLATPHTPVERLKLIDKCSNPFIYLISSSTTTGNAVGITNEQVESFKRIKEKVSKPLMVGFGISSGGDCRKVASAASGAIIGSAFLKALIGAKDEEEVKKRVEGFLKSEIKLRTEN